MAQQSSAAGESSAEACLICGGERHRVLYPGTYDGGVAEASDYFLAARLATAHGDIARCQDCGFVFTAARFSESEYDRIYGGIGQQELHSDPAFEAAKAARFRRLGRIVRKFAPLPARFLDYGCGDGAFLRTFGEPGGLGFEVGPPGRRMAGPYEIVTGRWAESAGAGELARGSFDFVTAFDVLEHLSNIGRDMELVRAVLKPGGLFFATVPDISSNIARLMGPRWNMLLLEHLWYFDPEGLRRLLERHGFEQVHVRRVPFDAPVMHIATRLLQTFGRKGLIGSGPLSRMVLPTPAGIMLGVYRAI